MGCANSSTATSDGKGSSNKSSGGAALTITSTVDLPSGGKMPLFGCGTWQVSDEASLRAAVDAGCRCIDEAGLYLNEVMVGNFLKNLFAEGNITREEIFVTSKLAPAWMTNRDIVREAFMRSLNELQLEYIDLYLIHFPVAVQNDPDPTNLLPHGEDGKLLHQEVDLVELWRHLEELVDEGKVKAIGVSNFNHKQIETIQNAAKVPISNVQNECHAYLQQTKLRDFLKKKNITFTSYGSLGSSHRGALYGVPLDNPPLLEDETVGKIAENYNKTPAQVLLRFLLQEGIAVIPKSNNPERVKENAQLFDFELSTSDMNTLRGLDRNIRYFDLSYLEADKHPNNPLKEEF